ncbi:MAG: DEAD/DEAH box helicase, partial [Kiritimatiellia bacterium]
MPECNIEICRELKALWPSARRVQFPPLPVSAAALLVEEMRRVFGRSVVVICESQRAADEFQANLETFLTDDQLLISLPPGESSTDWVDGLSGAGTRCQALFRLALAGAPVAVVTCVQAMLQTVPSRARFLEQSLKIKVGDLRDPEPLSLGLAGYGYEFVGEVHAPGQAARRGGLLDVWPPGMEWPCRLEFFGDQVETMRWFDPAVQRSRDATSELLIMPVHGDTPDPAAGGLVTPVAHLPDDAVYFWLEAAGDTGGAVGIEAHAEMCLAAEPAARERGVLVTLEELRATVRAAGDAWECFAGNLTAAPDAMPLDLGFRALAVPAGVSADIAAPDVFEARRRAWLEALAARAGPGRKIQLFFGTDGARQRFRELYPQLPFELCMGRITDGFQNDELGLTVVAEANLIGRRKWAGPAGRRSRSVPVAAPLADVTQIEPGDLVVHIEHGIGRYHGLCEIEFDGKRQEALAVEYADNAKLYVPVTHAHLLSRYVGSGGKAVALHRLGGLRWKREKRDAETAVRDLAASLLETQALRSARTGFAFPVDNLWQHEFEAAFPYQETQDQERALAEVRGDMQSTRPMDRLICGDAGYGKTEVAMRAAFRCVMAGRQAALLVPTTVLAQQHFECFRERMADYPVRVEMLCRFQTATTTARILRDLREGRVDIVIGTHRLVQSDVGFDNLGLVIIDEEQRFGVAHKERLKQLKQLVDV